jgi:hypothetical protein
MACQARVRYPLVLAALVICLVIYSSFNATSEVFQSTAPGTTHNFNIGSLSHVSGWEIHTVTGFALLLLSISVQWYIKPLKAIGYLCATSSNS